MSEEFKPIRITLSDEAFSSLDKIMKDAKFRSYSSTIEECIRVLSTIIADIHLVLGDRDKEFTPFTSIEAAQTFETIAIRMDRFTGRKIIIKKSEKK
jgi:hypothetical protein